MAVWGDVLYIYGGLIWRDKGCVGSLFAYHLLEGRWEVLHSDSKLSHDYPKGRSHHQMWAQAGRLNIMAAGHLVSQAAAVVQFAGSQGAMSQDGLTQC